MTRITTLAIAVTLSFSVEVAPAQDLTGVGMLATQVMSRTRQVVETDRNGRERAQVFFMDGDLLQAQARQPAGTFMQVSIHMEYQKGGEWLPVPVANNPLGRAYRSGHYPGLRDFVELPPPKANVIRNLGLFVPYDAMGLPGGKYARRYVIRIWDKDGEIEHRIKTLDEDEIQVERRNNQVYVTEVRVRACAAQSVVGPDGVIRPVPDDVVQGTIRYFNAESGLGSCQPQEQP